MDTDELAFFGSMLAEFGSLLARFRRDEPAEAEALEAFGRSIGGHFGLSIVGLLTQTPDEAFDEILGWRLAQVEQGTDPRLVRRQLVALRRFVVVAENEFMSAEQVARARARSGGTLGDQLAAMLGSNAPN